MKKAIVLTDLTQVELQNMELEITADEIVYLHNNDLTFLHPFGCTIRNVILTTLSEPIEELYLIMKEGVPKSYSKEALIHKFKDLGVTAEIIHTINQSKLVDKGITEWLTTTNTTVENLEKNIELLENHPLITKIMNIHGILYNSESKTVKSIKGDQQIGREGLLII